MPIPSYLLALACGNLASRRVGPRSHVWSEPEAVEACAFAARTRPDGRSGQIVATVSGSRWIIFNYGQRVMLLTEPEREGC